MGDGEILPICKDLKGSEAYQCHFQPASAGSSRGSSHCHSRGQQHKNLVGINNRNDTGYNSVNIEEGVQIPNNPCTYDASAADLDHTSEANHTVHHGLQQRTSHRGQSPKKSHVQGRQVSINEIIVPDRTCPFLRYCYLCIKSLRSVSGSLTPAFSQVFSTLRA